MKTINKVKCIVLSLLITALLFGCSKNSNPPVSSPFPVNDVNFSLISMSDYFNREKAFTDRDLKASYDDKIYSITLSDNQIKTDCKSSSVSDNSITIKKGGTYKISGKLSNGQIIVNADGEKVQIVLSNVDITNKNKSAIYVKSAKKVFLTLDDNSNNFLSTTDEFLIVNEKKVNGVIFSKDDLTLNGNGSLEIKSVKAHGIVCKDDLIVSGGNYDITAAKHAIKANDSVCIADGTLKLNCNKDGIHCDNDTDSKKGYIYIKDVNMSVNSDDDAIHSSSNLIIDGGAIEINKSYEGLEAKTIDILGGNINITSSDDGINASSGSNKTAATVKDNKNPFNNDENCYINIVGGKITVDANGDGIDSNGYYMQSGGNVTIYGPENDGNAALDYGIAAKINGGDIIAFGFSGMAVPFSSYSSQGSILVAFDNTSKDKFTLKNSNDSEIISAIPTKSYNCVLVSTADIVANSNYSAISGGETKKIELTSTSYSDDNAGHMGGGNMPFGNTPPDGKYPNNEAGDMKPPQMEFRN